MMMMANLGRFVKGTQKDGDGTNPKDNMHNDLPTENAKIDDLTTAQKLHVLDDFIIDDEDSSYIDSDDKD